MEPVTPEEASELFARLAAQDKAGAHEFMPGPTGKIFGAISRSAFRDLDMGDRVDWLYGTLREHFGERAKTIGLVFLFTPEEYAEYVEDRQTA